MAILPIFGKVCLIGRKVVKHGRTYSKPGGDRGVFGRGREVGKRFRAL
jgi:hypothetical protein